MSLNDIYPRKDDKTTIYLKKCDNKTRYYCRRLYYI